MGKKAVFWDFDGTLVHSNSHWSNSVFQAIGGEGNPYGITFDDVRPLMRSGLTWHMPQLGYPHMTGEAWWGFTRAALATLCIQLGVGVDEALRAAEKARELILDPSSYELYDDTRPALESCLSLGIDNTFSQITIRNWKTRLRSWTWRGISRAARCRPWSATKSRGPKSLTSRSRWRAGRPSRIWSATIPSRISRAPTGAAWFPFWCTATARRPRSTAAIRWGKYLCC